MTSKSGDALRKRAFGHERCEDDRMLVDMLDRIGCIFCLFLFDRSVSTYNPSRCMVLHIKGKVKALRGRAGIRGKICFQNQNAKDRAVPGLTSHVGGSYNQSRNKNNNASPRP